MKAKKTKSRAKSREEKAWMARARMEAAMNDREIEAVMHVVEYLASVAELRDWRRLGYPKNHICADAEVLERWLFKAA
jgi:hypothetical protein